MMPLNNHDLQDHLIDGRRNLRVTATATNPAEASSSAPPPTQPHHPINEVDNRLQSLKSRMDQQFLALL